MIKLKDILTEEHPHDLPPNDKTIQNEELESFADKRREGAGTITDNAKEKGGLSMLTYHHFNVKLPYYDKAANGALNIEEANKEYASLLTELFNLTKAGMQIDQKTFQELMGKIEVLGELIIRDNND